MKEWKWVHFNWPLLLLSVCGLVLWPKKPQVANIAGMNKEQFPFLWTFPAHLPSSVSSLSCFPFSLPFFSGFVLLLLAFSHSILFGWWLMGGLFRSCSWSIHRTIRHVILTNDLLLEECLNNQHGSSSEDWSNSLFCCPECGIWHSLEVGHSQDRNKSNPRFPQQESQSTSFASLLLMNLPW